MKTSSNQLHGGTEKNKQEHISEFYENVSVQYTYGKKVPSISLSQRPNALRLNKLC